MNFVGSNVPLVIPLSLIVRLVWIFIFSNSIFPIFEFALGKVVTWELKYVIFLGFFSVALASLEAPQKNISIFFIFLHCYSSHYRNFVIFELELTQDSSSIQQKKNHIKRKFFQLLRQLNELHTRQHIFQKVSFLVLHCWKSFLWNSE